jgi:hypothetical protein
MSLRSIPFWVYALVLVLGYNEFVYLFQMATNPLNFMLLLLAISIAVCFALLRKLRLLGATDRCVRPALSNKVHSCRCGRGASPRSPRGDLRKGTAAGLWGCKSAIKRRVIKKGSNKAIFIYTVNQDIRKANHALGTFRRDGKTTEIG